MTSLMTAGEAINQYVFPRTPMIDNYIEVWTSNNFQKYTINSIIISSITVIGVLITSIPAAYSFARIDFPFKNLIFYLLLLSLMIPEIITLLPHLLIIRGEIIPLPFGPSWMNTLQGLTVPFMGNIFVIFLLRQYFKKIPNELWDAARLDGSSHFYFLTRIVVPMSMPIIVTVALFTFIIAWNSFAWPLLILTKEDWYPVTVSIYSFVREVGPNFHLLMAACLIAIAPILIFFAFPASMLTYFTYLLGIIAILSAFYLLQFGKKAIILASFGAFLLGAFIVNSHAYPALLKYQGSSEAAFYIKEHDIPQDQLYQRNIWWRGFHYYSGGNVPAFQKNSLASHNAYVLTNEDGYSSLISMHQTELLKRFDHFNVTRLSLDFLNPKTRKSKLQSLYLVKIYPSD